jgi:hypothetical protein
VFIEHPTDNQYTAMTECTWVSDNLRDVSGWRAEGLPLTVSSNEVAKTYDCLLRQYVSYHNASVMGDFKSQLGRMMEGEPDFVMGQVLDHCMQVAMQKRSPYSSPAYQQSLDELLLLARAKSLTKREQKHAEAVHLCAHGYTRKACALWDEILAAHPNDLLALKMRYDIAFFLGDYEACRDVPGRVIQAWEPPQPQIRSYMHGIYSYGLEECGDFVEARRQSEIGLTFDPKCGWCVHAVAHCYEMESDYEGGLAYMEKTKPHWANCSALAPHNLWHTALFNVEKGDYETALTIYDDEMLNRRSGIILDITDSTSLLQRLQMEGVEVGAERWRELFALSKHHLDDHVLLFNDAHFSVVLSNSMRFADSEDEESLLRELCRKHMTSVQIHALSGQGDNAALTQHIGVDLCSAVYDYAEGRYSSAFERLYPVRSEMVGLGGSWAQRDVFKQLLVHSGLRSGDPATVMKALGVLEERELLKPNSPVAKRLVEKHKSTSPWCSRTRCASPIVRTRRAC